MKQFLLTAVLFCIPVTVAAAQDETAEPSVVENGDVSEGETETPPVAESEDSDADTLEKAKESASGLVNDAKDLVEAKMVEIANLQSMTNLDDASLLDSSGDDSFDELAKATFVKKKEEGKESRGDEDIDPWKKDS